MLITRKRSSKKYNMKQPESLQELHDSSLRNLYNEIKWESLQNRRDDHKATIVFLSSLVPPTVGSVSRYSLRDAGNLQNINTNTALYSSSFLPSAVRNWNDLPSEAKQIDSITSFKYFLARERERAPEYYYTCKRLCQILHARLRTNCSSFNYYLFCKHITVSPLCCCGTVEDANHYFFECRMCAHQRILLFDSISQFNVITLILLFGDPTLSLAENTHIFDKVQKFIIDTKRF